MSKPTKSVTVPAGTPATESCPLCCRPCPRIKSRSRRPTYSCLNCHLTFKVRQVQAQERPAVAA
jgi:hypothetical protein